MNILVTGATGMVGPALVDELLQLPEKPTLTLLVREASRIETRSSIQLIEGDITQPDLALSKGNQAQLAANITHIVHAAADTRFGIGEDLSRQVNVHGTRQILDLAESLPRFKQGVHLSTVCIAGNRGGSIAEAPFPERPGFINHYEATKWEAEQLVIERNAPWNIVRAAIVAGSEIDGSVDRLGALHRVFGWVRRGLVPMFPGVDGSKVDLVSSEHVARITTAALLSSRSTPSFFHASAGTAAAPLAPLVDHVHGLLVDLDRRWERGTLTAPMVVDAEAFRLFQDSVRASRDALFNRIADHAETFLPGLLHPRTLALEKTEQLCPEAFPPAPWQGLVEKVVHHLFSTDWGRAKPRTLATS